MDRDRIDQPASMKSKTNKKEKTTRPKPRGRNTQGEMK
jgi:hypothetical protein